MKKILVGVLWLLLYQNISVAQNGNYFLSHYTPSDEKIDYRSSGMVQDELGVVYFTNKSGVLEFDGKNWKIIPTKGAVYALAAQGHDVFVGGLYGFGKLSERTGALRKYTPLVDLPNIFSVVVMESRAYFCNEDQLFVYSLLSNALEQTINLPKGDSYSGIHRIENQIYVSTFNQGHLKLDNGKLVPPAFALPEDQGIVFSISAGKETILGTDESRLFRLSANQVSEVVLSDAQALSKAVLLSGVAINDHLVALGTLRGGVMFCNPVNGEVEENIDFFSGLPDNEVFALMTDKNEGVWVAHEYGFTRIAPNLPFRSFNHYPGLVGNLLCVQTIGGQLYAGTTLGLYFLAKEEVVEAIPVKQSGPSVRLDDEKGKRKILNFLRKRRKAKAETSEVPAPSKSTAPKTVKIVTSTIHRYKKVEGIDSKVTQLVKANGKLLAVGLDGVFEVENTTAKPLIEKPVRSVFLSKAMNQLFVGTFDEEIKTYEQQNNIWKETHLLDTLNDFVSYIFEDKLENIWLCGRTKIYKVETDEQQIINILTLPIENPSLDETVGLAYGSEVYIAASGEFKKYNGDDRFLRYDSLPGPHKYFASAGYFWFNDGHKWRTVDRRIQSLKLEWLGLFPNLRFLAPDEAGDGLWLITAENELFKFYNTKAISEGARYPLFLREIKGQEVNFGKEKSVKLNQPEEVISFEFIQPNYIGLHATEYRYQVKGLTNSWSAWSSLNNIIPFPYLAPGVYQLAAQSRDLLGNESTVELITFEVMPPYWKQWWFYALEFVFFSLLVAITVKLSANNERYRVISQVLSLLTVIMLIQFIQTGIESIISFKSSPVVEFFIQVSIALIVFPVEGFVKKMITRASSGRYRIPLNRKKAKDNDTPDLESEQQ